MNELIMDRNLLLNMQGYEFHFRTDMPTDVVAAVAFAIENNLIIRRFVGPTFDIVNLIEQTYYAEWNTDFDHGLNQELLFITIARNYPLPTADAPDKENFHDWEKERIAEFIGKQTQIALLNYDE